MSGNPTGSNVVPMPHMAAPATAPPQAPMPFPMWGGGGSLPWGPGCCPPGGMDALMKCYCDVQAATAFICSVMVQCIQHNPAVTAAIIAAIEASGSSLPLLGVTNGVPAQPGQVGEWVQFEQQASYTAAAQVQTVTMGVLQPGDWDFQIYAYCPTPVLSINLDLLPIPLGIGGIPQTFVINDSANPQQLVAASPVCQGLFAVPTLMPVQLGTNGIGTGPGAGNLTLFLTARRAR